MLVTHFKCSVSNAQRVLHLFIPVSVLVLQSWIYLVQVIVIGIPHKSAKNSVPSAFIESKFQVLRIEFQVRFCEKREILIIRILSDEFRGLPSRETVIESKFDDNIQRRLDASLRLWNYLLT